MAVAQLSNVMRVDCYNKIIKNVDTVPQYKTNCMLGEPHPLDIESQYYSLTPILTQHITANAKQFNFDEMEFIKSIAKRPEIEWAIHNSFDGLYVRKYESAIIEIQTIVFRFAVYLKEDHATFWKLKYG